MSERTESEKEMDEAFEREKQKMKGELMIKIDRSQEMKEKDAEIEQLKNTKSEADKVFELHRQKIEAQYERLGIPFESSKVMTLEDIRHHETIILKLSQAEKPDKSIKDFQGEGSPDLNSQLQASKWKVEDFEIPIEFMKFENEEELIDVVSHIANNPKDSRQKEASEYIEKLNQKLQKKGIDAEFQGEITKIQGQKDSEEKRRERRKWKTK